MILLAGIRFAGLPREKGVRTNGPGSEVRGQSSEVRGQSSEVRVQRSEFRNQKSTVPGIPKGGWGNELGQRDNFVNNSGCKVEHPRNRKSVVTDRRQRSEVRNQRSEISCRAAPGCTKWPVNSKLDSRARAWGFEKRFSLRS
jgi:hypothetical protein